MATTKAKAKAVKVRRTTGSRRTIYTDTAGTGPEPEWQNQSTMSPEQVKKLWDQGLYFYYYHHTVKELRPTIDEVMGQNWTKDQHRAFNKVKDWMLGQVLGPMCMMVKQGAVWPPGQEQRAQNYLQQALDRSQLASVELDEDGNPIIEKEKVEPVKLTIKDRMADIRNDIVGGLEEFEDQITKQSKSLPVSSIMTYLRSHNCPQQIIPYMENMYKGRLAFMQEVKLGKDKSLAEGYATYSPKTIDLWIKWYQMIVTDLADFKRAKIAARKPTVRKPASPEKLVKTLKYLREFPELNLKSIKPTEIVQCTQLWVYNTKTRKLGVYNPTSTDQVLSVKGSTIIGWDPKTSVAKTLRKPAEQLKLFDQAGKVQLRTFLGKIKATEVNLNGRINDQIILLKAFK
ncbi:MAG: hypothetical protein LLF94_08015 [Chlamydiales bacterium]|nr:hypothetical protein [Chlamydiales bacterium]